MFIADKLRKENIVGYLLYMWQMEDTLRVYGCDMGRLRREYIPRFTQLTDEQVEEEELWLTNLIRMMNKEGVRETGHLQINRVTLQQLVELNQRLLDSSEYPFYSAEYFRVLPYIVELRKRGAAKDESEVETCLNAVYGVTLLKMQGKTLSPDTVHAVKMISTFLGMLNDYYQKDKKEGLKF